MNKRDSQLPLARTEKLIVKEIDDEVLVYDLVSDKAHCLNYTSALVWKNCDGTKSVSEINARLAEHSDTPIDERVVWLALDQLERFKLLDQVAPRPSHLSSMNRRQLVRTMSVAALALPVIVSIAAQPAYAQASCLTPTGRPPNCPCTTDAQCLSNNCHGAPGNQKC
jgi:hypothetical protein